MRIDPRQLLRLPLPTLLLGVLTGVIFVVIAVVIAGGTRAAELLATPAKAASPLNIDLATAPPAPDLAAIQAHPLMHASRAFYSAPPPDATPVAPPLPDYRFAGAFIVPNKPAVALLGRQGGGTRRVHVGEELDGWKVQAVDARRVVLQWQDQQREIGARTVPTGTGLRRVPMQRQRLASAAGVQTLGAPISTMEAAASPPAEPGPRGRAAIDVPRLYSPPPPN